MIDFLKKQNEIKEFIKSKFETYLTEGLSAPSKYVDDFVDLDKYNQPSILFYNFSQYNFSDLSNESQNQEITFSVYFVCRGNNADTLKEKLLKYTACFYSFFEETGRNFGGLIDYGNIDTVNFYEAAEGNTNIKVSEIQMKLTLTDE